MWWIEYVVRHGGAKHLRAPAANITYYEYFIVDILLVVLILVIMLLSIVVLTIVCLCKLLFKFNTYKRIEKTNKIQKIKVS